MLDKSNPPQNPPRTAIDSEQKGDLLIRHLWERGTYCIPDMRAVDTYAASCLQKTPKKRLTVEEREKKYKYLEYYL